MTTPSSEPAAPLEPEPDPHAPKLSPDDPRLTLGRPRARTLRAGPIAALLGSLGGAGVLAVTLAFRPPRAKTTAGAEPSAGPPAPPVVPDILRNAPSQGAARTAVHDAGLEERPLRPASAEDPDRRAQRQLDRAARGAGIFFASARAPDDRAPSEGAAAPVPARTPSLEPLGSGLASPSSSADDDPNLQEHKNAFLRGQGGAPDDALQVSLQHPRSAYEIQAGTVLPAVLLTAINSDLPGPVVAQVREHVYDSVTGDHLLVPQGSRLIARYDSRVAWGQERVLLCWNRLILPDGDSIDLRCMPAADLQGAAGLADQVDEHWWRILKGATVATLLSAGTAFAAGDSTSYTPSVGQVVARSASGEIGEVGAQLTRSNLSIQPTITVRPGFSVNVVVTQDMTLPPYPDPPKALGLHE